MIHCVGTLHAYTGIYPKQNSRHQEKNFLSINTGILYIKKSVFLLQKTDNP